MSQVVFNPRRLTPGSQHPAKSASRPTRMIVLVATTVLVIGFILVGVRSQSSAGTGTSSTVAGCAYGDATTLLAAGHSMSEAAKASYPATCIVPSEQTFLAHITGSGFALFIRNFPNDHTMQVNTVNGSNVTAPDGVAFANWAKARGATATTVATTSSSYLSIVFP